MLNSALPPVIQGDSLLLRQWSSEDFGFYSSFFASDSNARFYGGAVDRQKAWRHLASVIGHWTLRQFGVYAVEAVGCGGLQGCIGLWEPHGWPCREFAYWFVPSAYDSGRALRAGQLALARVKESFPDEEIKGFIHPDNALALSLANAMGATLHTEVPLFDFGPHVQVSFFNPEPLQAQR
jgi:RimJ/RimL family protein N-acetyltransferase